ncbi:MAG: hypothetical protein SFV55_09595 [Haliscomenobacter sp.]|uniref:hypothetical protein n=1 Tax=Haliscomenobacter sp. TaxID=2717303 RepID=UPI0029AF4EA8|nr:hypothetical protein [Haliscomenobacter sp.]MDX2068668.1 hypothetical protein [Haliscomenobacter sp.]
MRTPGIRLVLAGCTLCFFALTGLGAQVTVSAQLKTQEILIGDQVRLTLRISLPAGTTFKAVKIKEALKQVPKVELVEQGSLLTVAREPQQILEQQFVLTSFEAGTYEIPPINIDFEEGGLIKSASAGTALPLKVSSIPVNPERDTLRAIKDINREEIRVSDFIFPALIVLVLLALLGLSIYYLLRRKRKQQPAMVLPPPPPPPAHETALQKLLELEQSDLLDNGEVNAFQTQLTYILREYLEGRYGIHALESTTDDILASLRNIGVPDEWRVQLRQMLQTADLVKFAKAQPPLSFHVEALYSVKTFVEQTKEEEDATVS